jgi:anti-sigma B factor antagonist
VPGIRYRRKMINGMPVVAAPAEIDIATEDQLRAVLLDSIGGGHPTVVMDMTHTQFCDSSGIHALLQAHQRALAEGGELRLVVPADGAVARAFTLTSLDRFIPCFASLEAALAEGSAGAIWPSRSHVPAGLGSPASSTDTARP